MKALIATGIAASALALSALAAAPVQASPYSLDTLSSNMMSAAQATSIGVAGNHIRDFQAQEGTKESPDDFWLCDLAGDTEVEVDGTRTVYEVSYVSVKSRIETAAGQDLYAFPSESDARAAMKEIRKAAKRCEGTFTVKDEGMTTTQRVSNGTGKGADGAGFTWIKHTTTEAEAGSRLAEHDYNTFRRIGAFIQVVSLDIVGPNAPKLTSSQISGVDRLTGTLGAAWG